MNPNIMNRGGYAPQQNLDVGNCGSPGACGPTGTMTGPGPFTQLAQPGAVYAIYFQLGFCGAIDDTGEFYSVSVTGSHAGSPSALALLYTPLGKELTFEIGQGYYQICGVNVTAAEDVCVSVFQNSNSLANIGGEVDLSIWSTDGCWCPFDECLSAANDSALSLVGRVVPSKGMEAQAIVTPAGTIAGYLSDLRLTFVGTLYRTVEGCQTVGVFAPLEQANRMGCAPGSPALGAGY